MDKIKNKKPKILCIVGKSGSGKTTIADYIEKVYDIPMIQSYTDRPPRYEGENGHIFLDASEFDLIHEVDMIAYTKFGNNRYCCIHDDVKPINTYVIDEKGLDYLQNNFSDIYDIYSLLIQRPLSQRKEFVDEERLARDKGMFYKNEDDYNYNIINRYDVADLEHQVDNLYKAFIKDI